MINLGVDKAIDLVRDMLSPVGNTLSDVWGTVIGDPVSHWRAKNALKYPALLAAESARLHIKADPSRISEKFAYTWFEEASKQDEPQIQVLFARLLARAAEESIEGDPDRRLIAVLSNLTPRDAALFQTLNSDTPFPGSNDFRFARGLGHPAEQEWPLKWVLSTLSKTDHQDAERSLEHLGVQGCLRRFQKLDFSRSGGSLYTRMPDQIAIAQELQKQIGQKEYVGATELGKSLYAAVRE